MVSKNFSILLADDDKDDCMFFKEALQELELSTQLTTVYDGTQLMQYLTENTDQLPDVIFLDLNMPRKNGFTCLEEIMRNEKLKSLPVIMFSTLTFRSFLNKKIKIKRNFILNNMGHLEWFGILFQKLFQVSSPIKLLITDFQENFVFNPKWKVNR